MFCTQHTSHSQLPAAFLNLSPKPSRGAAELPEEDKGGRVAGAAAADDAPDWDRERGGQWRHEDTSRSSFTIENFSVKAVIN